MQYIIWLLLIFLVFFALFWIIFRKLLKALLFAKLLTIIIVLIFGFLLYKDAVDFSENFPIEPKLFLFEEDGEIVAGVILASFNFSEEDPDMAVLTVEELAVMNSDYGFGHLRNMLADNYMMFIFKSEMFDGIEVNMSRKSDLSDIPPEMLTEEQRQQQNSIVYFAKFNKLMENGDPMIIIRGHKQDNIIIYPPRLIFKLLKQIPDSLFETISEKLQLG